MCTLENLNSFSSDGRTPTSVAALEAVDMEKCDDVLRDGQLLDLQWMLEESGLLAGTCPSLQKGDLAPLCEPSWLDTWVDAQGNFQLPDALEMEPVGGPALNDSCHLERTGDPCLDNAWLEGVLEEVLQEDLPDLTFSPAASSSAGLASEGKVGEVDRQGVQEHAGQVFAVASTGISGLGVLPLARAGHWTVEQKVHAGEVALSKDTQGSTGSVEAEAVLKSRKRRVGKSEELQSTWEDGQDENIAKRQKRLIRNREAAFESRERRKSYIQSLEARYSALETCCQQLRQAVNATALENMALKEELARYQRAPPLFAPPVPAVASQPGKRSATRRKSDGAEPAALESDSLPSESLLPTMSPRLPQAASSPLLLLLLLLVAGPCLGFSLLLPREGAHEGVAAEAGSPQPLQVVARLVLRRRGTGPGVRRRRARLRCPSGRRALGRKGRFLFG